MQPINVLALGADPEVFLVDENGNPFSAEGLFGGTKSNPKPMKGLPPGFFIQEDNVSAEYNIPPSQSPRAWAMDLQKGLTYIRKVARRRGLSPFLAANLDFPVEQLCTAHAQELGCDPDFNAWTQQKNPRPRPPERMRTAAAHIHVSWENPDDEQRWAMVRAMDLFLGVPSILATPANDRRKLYGRAGACRPKKYGVEYRVLDNFYLDNPNLSMAVGNRVYQAARQICDRPLLNQYIERVGDKIQIAINEHNRDLAVELMDHFDINGF